MKYPSVALFAALLFAFATLTEVRANEYTGQIVERHGEQVLAIVFKDKYCVLCLYERHKWGALYDQNPQTFLRKVSELNPGIVYDRIPRGTVVYFPLPRGIAEKVTWYEKLLADMRQKTGEILEEAELLRQRNAALARENETLRSENATLKQKVAQLTEENAALKEEKRKGGVLSWRIWPWNWGDDPKESS